MECNSWNIVSRLTDEGLGLGLEVTPPTQTRLYGRSLLWTLECPRKFEGNTYIHTSEYLYHPWSDISIERCMVYIKICRKCNKNNDNEATTVYIQYHKLRVSFGTRLFLWLKICLLSTISVLSLSPHTFSGPQSLNEIVNLRLRRSRYMRHWNSFSEL